MPTNAYVGGKSVATPAYDGPTIDTATPEELAAALFLRARQQGAVEQQVANTEAISALTSAKGDIAGLQQRVDALRRDLASIAELHAAAADATVQARSDAEQALAAAQAVPAVDLQAAARLAAEVVTEGSRAVNRAAAATEQITQLTTDTVAQTEALKAEVVALQGNATATVEAIQRSADALVSDAQTQVQEMLNTTPEAALQMVRSVLSDVEVLAGGEVDPGNRFQWLWQFSRLGNPEEITRTVAMPILPGFDGQPGRSGSPIVGGGGGGGGGTGNLYLQANLVPSQEMPLKIQNRTNTALAGRDFKGPALVKFSINEANAPDNWVVGTLDLAAAMNAPGAGVFTVAAELQGPGVPPEFTFRVEQMGAGVNSSIALFVTCNVQAEFLGTFIEIQP